MGDAATGTGLTPLPVDQWSDEARRVLPRYLRRPELYLSGAPDAPAMPQVMGLLAHNVPVGAAWLEFGNLLAGEHATLPPTHRELAILRVAWRTGSAYEWNQHTRIGQSVGLSAEQLHAVPDGARAEIWTPPERSLLDAVDQVVDRYRIDAATWRDLGRVFDAAQLLELVFVIGSYVCFSAVVNTVGLVPDPPTESVDAPELRVAADE